MFAEAKCRESIKVLRYWKGTLNKDIWNPEKLKRTHLMLKFTKLWNSLLQEATFLWTFTTCLYNRTYKIIENKTGEET